MTQRRGGRGRSTPAAIALWLAATGVAVAAAGGAVRVVTNQVLDPLPPPTITSTQTDVMPAATDAPTESPSPEASATDSASAEPSEADPTTTGGSPAPAPAETATPAGTPTTDRASTSDGPSPASDAATPSATGSPTDAATESDARPTDDPSDGPSSDDDATDDASESDVVSDRPSDGTDHTVRTVTSEGGSASFEWAGGQVRLRWATPEPGFRVSVQEEPGEVSVYFESAAHESRIKADYDGRQPRVRVEERPHDGREHD